MANSYMLRYAVGGVNQSVDPAMLSFNQMRDAVNVQVKDSLVASRPGVRVHKLDVEGNFQGAAFFNPSKGQSQKQFSTDESSLVASFGGARYKIKIPDVIDVGSPEIVPLDTDLTTSSDEYHLAFLRQCENYMICQDGNGSTWIWDGEKPPEFSPGYNSTDKENSRLANGASVVAYAHGRIVQVVNNRQVLVGDIIHKGDLTTASNILGTTEQTYWASGSFFGPPSELGAIRAAEILPLRDTAHGHGDLMFHTDEGIFSLDLAQYPRDTWVDKAISKHVLLDTGAAGYYAITLMDGDQLFLSRHGLQTLRSARAESQRLGNPFLPISAPVESYVDADVREHFKYASVEKFVEQRRLFMTTQHMIQGGDNRGARGLLVLNFQPTAGGEQAWEGLWTLPGETGLINQLVSGVFEARERLFAFTTSSTGEHFLVEFSSNLPADILSDGSTSDIEWQVLTRSDTGGDEAEVKTYEKAWATIRNVEGNLNWEISARTEDTCWRDWHEGGAYKDEGALRTFCSRDLLLKLGTPPSDTKSGTKFQMLLKFRGKGSLESIKMTSSLDRGGLSSPTKEGACIVLTEMDTGDDFYNPFSYHNV